MFQTSSGKCEIKVKRASILNDSYNAVMSKTQEELLRRLWITFEGEPGLDYGGLARFKLSIFNFRAMK